MKRIILTGCAVFCLLLGFAAEAQAGCCLSGATTFTHYSGIVQVAVGDGICYFLMDNCNITFYHYYWCEEGPFQAVSMRISGFPKCNYGILGICLENVTPDVYWTSGEGWIEEWTRSC